MERIKCAYCWYEFPIKIDAFSRQTLIAILECQSCRKINTRSDIIDSILLQKLEEKTLEEIKAENQLIKLVE